MMNYSNRLLCLAIISFNMIMMKQHKSLFNERTSCVVQRIAAGHTTLQCVRFEFDHHYNMQIYTALNNWTAAERAFIGRTNLFA